MNIAIILVHNLSEAANSQQITTLQNLLTTVTDGPFLNEETDEEWTTFHQEVVGLGIPHTVKVYQIIPYGVIPPTTRYEINSGGIVQYGKGDEDKTGDHPRFFNWGLKRGTDYGADLVIHIEDISKLDFKKLLPKLQKLADRADTTELVEDASGIVASLKLLKEVGQLDEGKTKAQALTELRSKVVKRGFKNG